MTDTVLRPARTFYVAVKPDARDAVPDEVAGINRMRQLSGRFLYVDLGDGAARSVRIVERVPLTNPVRPDLSLLVFRLVPTVLTPYLNTISGLFYMSGASLSNAYLSWLPGADMAHITGDNPWRGIGRSPSQRVPFTWANEDTYQWLRRLLAQAGGARFREHDIGGHVQYTREP